MKINILEEFIYKKSYFYIDVNRSNIISSDKEFSLVEYPNNTLRFTSNKDIDYRKFTEVVNNIFKLLDDKNIYYTVLNNIITIKP